MTTKPLPQKVVDKMLVNDPFTRWLGITLIKIDDGSCQLEMTVREEMMNGFKIAHGGITYSLADSALAFASNSQGRKSVSIETSISHTKPCVDGDILTANAKELSKTNKIAIYEVTITNQNKEIVALFKGTVYRTSKFWI